MKAVSAMRAVPTNAIPTVLRQAYLTTLPEPQELFVEQAVARSHEYLIQDQRDGTEIGYAAASASTLVELFVRDGAAEHYSAALQAMIASGLVDRALCKTFDQPLLEAAARNAISIRTVAISFAALTPWSTRLYRASVADRRARTMSTPSSRCTMVFFDSPAEVIDYLVSGGLFIFSDTGDGVLGCGLMKRVIPDWDAIDIGMVVARAQRGCGLGARIVAHMVSLCIAAGDRPIRGCGAENVASRRALEKAGFRTDHQLVEALFSTAAL